MNRKRIILFSLFLLFYSVSIGQLVPSIAYSGKNFSVEDGLSQPRITDIYSDKQGFLWIGTEDGLNRYDGYQFEKYRHFPGDSTSIGNNYIHCISEDPNGNIWVGTGQGLSFKKKNSTGFQNIQFHREDSIRLINQAIQEIYLADSNILWLKSDSYFEKYNIETGKILSYRFSTDYENYSIQKKAAPVLRDKYGNFWFGSHRGLYSFDEDKCEFTSYNNIPEHPIFLNNNAILSLKEDPDGKLWIGTEKGLYSLDDDRVQFKKYLESFSEEDYSVHEILFLEEKLFLVCKNSIIEFDEQTGKVKEKLSLNEQNNEIAFSQLSSGVIDANKILWIGGRTGLFKIDLKPKRLNLLNNQQFSNPVLSGASVNALLEDSKSRIWIGYGFEGLELLSPADSNKLEFKSEKLFRSLSGLEIRSLSEDKKGRIWVGTSEGIFIIGNDFEVREFHNLFNPDPQLPLEKKCVNHVYQDKNGNFWFACDQGLFRFNESTNSLVSFEKPFGSNVSPGIEPVYTIAADSFNLWLGTGNGLIVYDISQNIFLKPGFINNTSPKLENTVIYSIYPKSDGELCIGTNYGLYMANTKTGELFLYTEKEGLPSNYVFKIIEDRSSNIWFSTNMGISMMDLSETKFINYNSGDGIQDFEFKPGSGMITRSGQIFFGGISGLNYFFPEKIPGINNTPGIIISRIELIDKEGNIQRVKDFSNYDIRINFDQAIRIYFSGNDFSHPELNTFVHSSMPSGKKAEWIESGTGHSVTLSNLKEKNYVFRVKSNIEAPPETEARLKILVESPFYRSKAAIILYSLLALILVYFLIQYRTRELRHSNHILRERDIAAKEVSRQKDLLSRRNKNIEDSLKYASRIQSSMLITPKSFKQIVPESFILHKPKDIVSGDFYWVSEVKNKVFVAAIDCTGHGVPGAFMSIIGFELFRKIINTQGVSNPGDILNSLNDNIEEIFGNGEEISLRDGMDLAFCVIDKQEMVMEFAGAFNPIYLVRDNKLVEIKGDRFSIGADPDPIIPYTKKFTTQRLKINKEDIIYMFSDGFADQFGGPEGKKYKYRRFRHLLLTIHNFPLEKQRKFLEDSIEEWKGNMEQVDDILVIGIRPKF